MLMNARQDPQTLSDAVQVSGLSLVYGQNTILDKIDLTVPTGHIVALLGASGCGKTTLLRLMAGLAEPTKGVIRIQGGVVADTASGVFLPPEKRGLGMVFQDYALWPHLTIGGNVAFPLEMRGVPANSRRERVESALARVGLAGFADRSPASLSGGQQQRVAIARAIVAEPELVLFDEPLSNLDKELRDQLSGEIVSLVRSLGLSAVYVTHDQGEAFSMADSIAVMRGGHIVQNAAPEVLFDQPADAGVAEFLNLGAVFRAVRGDGVWRLEGTDIVLDAPPAAVVPADVNQAQVLFARRALAQSVSPETARVKGEVLHSQYRGDHYLLAVRLDASASRPLDLVMASERKAQPGEKIGIDIMAERLRWFA